MINKIWKFVKLYGWQRWRIPVGDYCHNKKTCPYWERIESLPKQQNGYCHLMGKGDVSINNDPDLMVKMRKGGSDKVVIMQASDMPFGISLLWDQVKGCNIRTIDKKAEKEFQKQIDDIEKEYKRIGIEIINNGKDIKCKCGHFYSSAYFYYRYASAKCRKDKYISCRCGNKILLDNNLMRDIRQPEGARQSDGSISCPYCCDRKQLDDLIYVMDNGDPHIGDGRKIKCIKCRGEYLLSWGMYREVKKLYEKGKKDECLSR